MEPVFVGVEVMEILYLSDMDAGKLDNLFCDIAGVYNF